METLCPISLNADSGGLIRTCYTGFVQISGPMIDSVTSRIRGFVNKLKMDGSESLGSSPSGGKRVVLKLSWLSVELTIYISFVAHLNNSSVAGHTSDLALLSEPNDHALPVDQPSVLPQIGRYAVMENRVVSGVLWVRIKHSWTESEYRPETISKDDIQFNYQGWVKAYDADGEPAFEFWVSC